MLSIRTGLISMLIVLLMLISVGFGMYISWNRSGGAQDSLTPDNPPAISEERPVNVVVTGNANLTISYLGSDNEAKSIDKDTILFGNQWTPGHKEVVYLTITNNGENNVNYSIGVNVNSETGSVNIAGEEFKLSDHLMFGFAEEFDPAGETDIVEALSSSEKVSSGVSKSGTLSAEQNSVTLALVVYLPETSAEAISVAAGNKVPEISLGLSLLATQPMGDNNSAELPELPEGFTASTTVTDVVTDGVLSSTVTIGDGESMGAVLPEGVKIAEGATDITLNVTGTSRSSNIDMNFGQLSRSLDVHIDGIADDNDVPMAIYLGAILPIGYNTANIALYHVENGEAIKMELVEEFTAHNQYIYNAETGEVIIYIASFSEVTAVINDGDPWQGDRDYDWYNKPVTETIDGTKYTVYYISTAEELAGFGAIVGGMDGKTADNFAGKVVKLKNSISIGDLTDEDGRDVVFYPIGYYNSEGTYEKTGTAITSGFRNFEGTFDGQGHTISDWYQNTWEMKGDHNWYDASLQYYRDGMGLFGKVYKGTVKNLVVRNFSSDGEITTTGTIAAYADGAHFENIQIYNCNPRVYNIGNGGIVGVVGWYAKEAGLKTTFKNITVDNSNKISALWGSWDVSCGGIVGQYYDFSGQSSAGKPENGGIYMEDCISAAVIDVYNDVCGNYQYYQYRYAGMLVGTLGSDTTPASSHIKFDNVKVYIGNWADYYFCEFEKNSGASYTEDFQFSRVEKNEIIFDDSTNLPKGCTHEHTENEDKLAVYLPFEQLYTGYGWGSSPVKSAEGVTVVKQFYSITYKSADGKTVYATEYVTDGERSENKLWADAYTVRTDAYGTPTVGNSIFKGWVNAGSVVKETIDAGNRNDIVLFESWSNPYVARFVDQFGNVIHTETFTSDNRKLNHVPGVPEVKGFAGSWEDYSKKLANAQGDITIKPVYSLANAQIKLTPVDDNNDGITDKYYVTGVDTSGKDDVDVPAYLNGIPITQISDNAFADFSDIRDIDLPNTLEYLGADAFADEEKNWIGRYKYETIQIFFDGTKKEWDALVAKSDVNWDQYVGDTSVVICKNENPAGYYKLECDYHWRTGKKENAEWVWVEGEYERTSYNETTD